MSIKEKNLNKKVQLVAGGSKIVTYCESSMQDFLHVIPWKTHQAMAVIWFFAIFKKEQKVWIKGMEDKMHDWKFLVASYKDTHFEWVEEKTDGGQHRQQGGVHIGDCGATGVEFVANKLVLKEGSDCCGGEWGGCCLRNKKRQWWNGCCRGGSWCYDEEFGILTPGCVSVAEEQLCRRFHVPGFWRQGRYYCILYVRGEWNLKVL